jgi:hypothetical protein
VVSREKWAVKIEQAGRSDLMLLLAGKKPYSVPDTSAENLETGWSVKSVPFPPIRSDLFHWSAFNSDFKIVSSTKEIILVIPCSR